MYIPILFKTTQHHSNSALSLHYHLPEVSSGTLHWTLSHNECLLLLVSLNTTSNTKCANNDSVYVNCSSMNVVWNNSFQIHTMLVS